MWYTLPMNDEMILDVVFFRTESGNEPVREWLREMAAADRKSIGEDVQTVQFRWPLGMPLVRKMETGLWEVRSKVSDGRIARVFFTVIDREMVLLHGIIKKSQKTAAGDLEQAKDRRNKWRRG